MTYWSILRRQHVFRVLFGSWVGRLAMAMAAVAIPLALRDAGADYVFIGLVAGSFAISAAIGSPIIGRIVDRVGQVRVLVPTGLLAAAGFVLIAVAPSNHALVLTGAVLAGALTPPLEPCLRVLWPGLVGDDELEKAYAVDSAAQELVFVFGPLVVSLCLAVFAPVSALWAQALLTVVGVAMFATASPARRWTPEKVENRHWLGPLRHRGLMLLLLAPIGMGVAIGTLNVLVVSYAERFEVFGGAPMLLTLNALASLVGVLIYGLIPWKIQPRTRIVYFSVGLLVGYGLLATVPSPLGMAGLMLLTGFFLAPMLAALFGLIGDLAPRGTVTEAFAWLVTLFAAGSSLGAAVVGPVLDRDNLNLAAAHAGVGALFCLLMVSVGYRMFVPAKETALA
uniref:MFS transporter n=1 Tax=Nocardia interforma ATCC 21072 TaxID=1311815 RepID=A0A5S8ZHZ0_9NOCA|nr:MFS transporter [Nocardia interforma ATCC 21072]